MKKGKALVTGATSGIGAAYAEKLAKEGYDVIMIGRRMDKLSALAVRLGVAYGVNCTPLQAELSDEEGIRKVENAVRDAGGIDFLVSNAGFGFRQRFLETPLERHVAMLKVHDEASVRLAYLILPGMLERKSGAMVFTSSVAAFVARPDSGLYTPTKAFLNYLVRSLDMGYYRRGVKFQALCPGFTHTDFHERIGIGREKQVNHGYYRWMEPSQVVERSWKDLKRGILFSVPGFFNRFLVALTSVMPNWLIHLVTKNK